MKLVLYIIALVAIIGAAAVSMLNIDKHQEQLDLTKAENTKLISKKVDVEDRDEERITEEGLRDAQLTLKDENTTKKELRQKDERDQQKLSANLKAQVEDLLKEKADINATIEGVKQALGGLGVPIEEIAGVVEERENEKKDLENANTALGEQVAIFKGSVEGNKTVISDFKNAQIKRRNNLNANKVSSLITAVDNEWGFVVVKPHEGSLIKPESKLIVIRGNKHIGRLSINAIEGEGRVLANIDYSSLVRGMKIRPGDRVILSEPVTQ